jgi:cytochrome c553
LGAKNRQLKNRNDQNTKRWEASKEASFLINMMKKLTSTLIGVAALLSGFQVLANDAEAGHAKADVACALCHGPNGLASLPNAPNLAGQQAIYLKEQLTAYRNGRRQNDVMSVIAKNLTDAEINQLSAWFSSLKVTVEMP